MKQGKKILNVVKEKDKKRNYLFKQINDKNWFLYRCKNKIVFYS